MRPLMILSFLLLFSSSGFAKGPTDNIHSSNSSLSSHSKNACDKMDAPQEVIDKCRKQEGKSDWYKEKLKRQAKQEETQKEKEKEAKKEAERKEELEQAIETKKFSRKELKEKIGFGHFDFIAQEIVFHYYNNSYTLKDGRTETKDVTSPHYICQKLGYEKASKAEIQEKEIDGKKLKGKALYFREPGFFEFNKDTELETWSWDGHDHEEDINKNVRVFNSVTCKKSSIEDNDVLEAVEVTTNLVGKDHAPGQQSENDEHIDDSSRRTASDSELDSLMDTNSCENNVLIQCGSTISK